MKGLTLATKLHSALTGADLHPDAIDATNSKLTTPSPAVLDSRWVKQSGGSTIAQSSAANALNITQTGDAGSTTGSSGAPFLNNTANPGIGVCVYSNTAGTATAQRLSVRANNTAFNQAAAIIDIDGTQAALELRRGNSASNQYVLKLRRSKAAAQDGCYIQLLNAATVEYPASGVSHAPTRPLSLPQDRC